MTEPRPKSRSKRGARGVRRRLVASAKNALELMRFGRLGEAYGAPFEVVDVGPHHRLRRYVTTEDPLAPPALFVPPLMVTSEIYDLAADTSAVASFGERGIQPFVLDFGAPERESGGLERTLDDHVKAVVRAIERVRELTGRDVHLLGYSQGGMFCYQAAAYVQGKGLKSVVTFGSPVDIHKGSPIRNDIASALVHTLEPALAKILGGVESLPSKVTSLGFKLVSTRKEIEQRLQFLGSLHDRQALVRREARRRFLNGEGFVAWPGPAFQRFVEDFVVHNRMLAGGFVIDGRTVTLADIRCPILAFIGAHDEIARPAAVRAIAEAAPNADVSIVTTPAGHFGIVVGSQAMARTWPYVAKWIYFHEGRGPAPSELPEVDASQLEDEYDAAEFDVDFDLLDTVKSRAGGLVKRVLDWTSSASDTLDAVRYQEPRLRELERISADTAISAARVLRERAAATPEATFFLWHGRAFSYADADRRVTNVTRGLIACGVKTGDKVGVLMASRPSFLSVVTALSRLGAVPVVAAPDSNPNEVKRAFADEGTSFVVSDPEHGETWRRSLGTKVLVLGGGSRRSVAPGLFDMEAVDPDKVDLPQGTAFDDSRARDLAFILLRPNDRGALRAARVTNHRWALSAMGAAAACTIKPSDTVYTSVPLHHPTGIVVSAGAALVGGARLALGARFDPSLFLEEVRRVGATIVFYAGEMLRPLLFEPPRRGDKSLPIRLFAGSGMRDDLVVRLRERFGVNSLEFYAGTQHHAILANASGEKPGALGRVLPGSADVTLIAVDLATRAPARTAEGHLVRVEDGRPGLLAVRTERDAAVTLDPSTLGTFDGHDRWVVTGDVLRRDDDGDYWFVDAASGFVLRDGTAVSTREVESAFYTLPEVRLVTVVRDEESLVAVIEGTKVSEERLTAIALGLSAPSRPDVIRLVAALPITEGYRPDRKAAIDLEPSLRFVWDAAKNEYRTR